MISIFEFVHSTIAIGGMFFNALLFYMALYQSHKGIRSYATLIAAFSITDFGACFAEVFVEQRLIPAGWSLAYVSNGVCRYISSTACFVGYSFMLHCFSHSIWLLFLSFSYRYYILHNPEPKQATIILIILIFYIPSFFQFITFLWAQDEPSEILEILRIRFPQYHLDEEVVTGTKNIVCFSAMFTILHMTLPTYLIYALIMILRRKIIAGLSFQGVKLTKTTKTLHTQLLVALTCQAILPMFYALSVASYVIGQLGIYNHPALEYFTFASNMMVPVLSPIISFIFVTPYRRFLIRLICGVLRINNGNIARNQVQTDSSMLGTIA